MFPARAADQRIPAVTGKEGIIAGTAAELVIVCSGDARLVAAIAAIVAAVEVVVALFAEDLVIARATEDSVIAPAGRDGVVDRTTADPVIAMRIPDHIITIGTEVSTVYPSDPRSFFPSQMLLLISPTTLDDTFIFLVRIAREIYCFDATIYMADASMCTSSLCFDYTVFSVMLDRSSLASS